MKLSRNHWGKSAFLLRDTLCGAVSAGFVLPALALCPGILIFPIGGGREPSVSRRKEWGWGMWGDPSP